MLTKEKPPIKIKSFSKIELSKTPFIFPKIGFLIGFLLILGIGFGIYALFPEPKKDENYLLELITRIQGGEELPSGEWKDYCHLMAVLRDSISPQCVCILDGINWNNPPRSPEKLPEGWQEYKNSKDDGNRRFFKQKVYPKIKIDFDAEDSQGREKPHWHRQNPNYQSQKDQYLDRDCNIVRRYHPHSHLYVRLKR